MEQIFMQYENFDHFQCSYATIFMLAALGNQRKKTISDTFFSTWRLHDLNKE